MLQLLPCLWGAPGFKQQACQAVSEVVKSWSQLERAPILVDSPFHHPGLGVRFGQGGMHVRQLRGVLRRDALPGCAPEFARAPEGLRRLQASPQRIEDQRPVEQRLDVSRIQRQRPVQRGQRSLRLSQHVIRQAQQMMDVREAAAGPRHVLQEVHGAVVVLHREALFGGLHQLLSADVHGSPCTSRRRPGHRPAR